MTVVDDAMATFSKKQIKRLRAGSRPLRRCLTYHDCFWCEQPIFLGEYYYDGGYGNRIHQTCFEKEEAIETQEGESHAS